MSSRRMLCALLVTFAAGCPSVQMQGNLDSGITGTITRGPICPVQRIGDPACDDQPYAGTVAVRSPSGAEVTRFTAADDGTFRVPLVPGDYILTPLPGPNGFPHAADVPVTVASSAFIQIDISYDTGIR